MVLDWETLKSNEWNAQHFHALAIATTSQRHVDEYYKKKYRKEMLILFIPTSLCLPCVLLKMKAIIRNAVDRIRNLRDLRKLNILKTKKVMKGPSLKKVIFTDK